MTGNKYRLFIKFLITTSLFFITFVLFQQKFNSQNKSVLETSKSGPLPTIVNPFPYNPPNIPNKRAYITMLVGDSIIGSLGPNANLLRLHLIELLPTHEFVNYNYGFGSTNIETLQERLTKETEYEGQKFPSVLSQGFDLIIIESFAYNPLSGDETENKVEKHLKILDESVRKIIREKPNTVVALMTPIAPNSKYFAKGVYDLSPVERLKWVEERKEYITGVIDYARQNNIPLINVYEKSLNSSGDGDLKYINPDDYIHPSHVGVDFMARVIANFIFENKIFKE